MLYQDFSTKLLGLQDAKITNVKETDGILQVTAELNRKPHKCPSCGTTTNTIHDYRTQVVRDIPAFGMYVQIHLRKRRYRCSCGKRFAEKNPWLAKYRRNTPRMTQAVIEDLTDVCSYTKVAKKFAISVTTVQRIFDVISYPKPSMPNVLAIDEFKGNTGGEKYNAILTDPENRVVLDILPKRQGEYLSEYFTAISRKERKKTNFFVSDMWEPYVNSAAVYFHGATQIVDKYHWVRQCSLAMDEVRKQVQSSLDAEGRRLMKRSRYILLKHYEELSEKKQERLKQLLLLSPTLNSAYYLKEQLYAIVKKSASQTAIHDLSSWLMAAEASGLEAFVACAKTFHNWSVGICNSLRYPYTNGFTEGCNNKIKVLKRNAYGLKNFNRFRNRILHIFFDQKINSITTVV